jgi:transcriptional regulator with XRE-family HTH domain
VAGDETLGARLRRYREGLGWSVRHLGRRAEVSDATISRIEHGIIKEPGRSTLQRLARVLGLSIDDLVGIGTARSEDMADQVLWAYPALRAALAHGVTDEEVGVIVAFLCVRQSQRTPRDDAGRAPEHEDV